jgi:hypothetical protein
MDKMVAETIGPIARDSTDWVFLPGIERDKADR